MVAASPANHGIARATTPADRANLQPEGLAESSRGVERSDTPGTAHPAPLPDPERVHLDNIKIISRPNLSFVWMFIAALLGTSTMCSAQCSTFVYDFNSLSSGPLWGQDGWTMPTDGVISPNAQSGTGFDGTTAVSAFSSGAAQGSQRALSRPFTYFATSQPILWSLRTRAVSNSGNLVGVASLWFDPAPPPNTRAVIGFGLVRNNGAPIGHTFLFSGANGSGVNYRGDSLTLGDWYEIRISIDFSQVGGRATLEYRNLSMGQTMFTTDGTIVNRPLGQTPSSEGYTAHWMAVRVDNIGGSAVVDDLRFGGMFTLDGPASMLACPNGAATFNVSSSVGTGTYEWQVRPAGMQSWTPLVDGPVPGVGAITGSATPSLHVDRANDRFAPSGTAFRCVVSNDCGRSTSNEATLTVCIADYNCDNFINSQDVFDFLTCFFTPGCPADFNRDGTTNSQDFFDFLAAFFTGCG